MDSFILRTPLSLTSENEMSSKDKILPIFAEKFDRQHFHLQEGVGNDWASDQVSKKEGREKKLVTPGLVANA